MDEKEKEKVRDEKETELSEDEFYEIRAPLGGVVWRIGNSEREDLKPGDVVERGEEIANLEFMKMETPIYAPSRAQIVEILVKRNQTVEEGQVLFILRFLE